MKKRVKAFDFLIVTSRMKLLVPAGKTSKLLSKIPVVSHYLQSYLPRHLTRMIWL